MSQQIKCLAVSAGVHGLLVILVLWLTASAGALKEVVTIDFSLEKSPALAEAEQVKQSGPPRPYCSPALPKQVRQALTQKAPPGLPVSDTAAPATAGLSQQPATAADQAVQPSADRGIENGHALGSAAASVTGAGSLSPPAASNSNTAGTASAEQVKKRYLKEHFSYIRDLIIKRLGYPQIARRMEWCGKVVLAFVVDQDGGVRSVQIKESSGYPVLDKCALDTVKNAAPFPRPPVAAEIVMPVHFKLQ